MISLTGPALHIKLEDPFPILRKASVTELRWADVSEPAGTGLVVKAATGRQPTRHWTVWCQIVYWAVTIALGIRLLLTLFNLISKAKNKGKAVNGLQYISNTKRQNSSFFNLMFLDLSGLTKEEAEQVTKHERLHYRLLHSMDNLFLEFCKIFLWFNPLIYLFAKELRQTHEFQVDQHIAADDGKTGYSHLLVKLCVPVQKTLTNQFSSGELRGRINMLIRSRSAKSRQLNYLPAMALLFILGFSLSLEQAQAGTDNIVKRGIDSSKLIKGLSVLTEQVVPKAKKESNGLKNQGELRGLSDENSVPLKIFQKPIQVSFSARDSIITDRKNNLILLYGTAKLTIDKTKIIADYIKYDHLLSIVYAKGIHRYTTVKNSDNKVLADSLILNIKTRDVILYNSSARQQSLVNYALANLSVS